MGVGCTKKEEEGLVFARSASWLGKEPAELEEEEEVPDTLNPVDEGSIESLAWFNWAIIPTGTSSPCPVWPQP